MLRILDDITAPAHPPRSQRQVGDGGRWRVEVVASPDAAMLGESMLVGDGGVQLGRRVEGPAGLRIDDALVSRAHTALALGKGGLEVRDLASHNGTWINGRRGATYVCTATTMLRVGATVLVAELESDPRLAWSEPSVDVPGRSVHARRIRAALAEAALDREPVLVQGDTGTGKEHAARELHRLAARTGQLVRVNLATIPDGQFDPELLGNLAGDLPGRLREADQGTLVLEGIGDLGLAAQAKLLHSIDTGLVRPVGALQDVRVDVQFVAVSLDDAETLVQQGRLRRELLARFRTHCIAMPPIRQRQADLLALCDAVQPLERPGAAATSWQQVLGADAVEVLLLHDWPDNLRELRAALVRLGHLAVGEERISGDDLRYVLHARRAASGEFAALPHLATERPPRVSKSMPSRRELTRLLGEHAGNVNQLAHVLACDRRQVYRWLSYAQISRAELERFRRGAQAG